jgi:hypothetical protein
LKKNKFIQHFLAAFMLAVFAFSITPKIILHHFVANHKDTPFASNFEKTAQLTKAGFNCNCDNQVVESPFTDDIGPSLVFKQSFFSFYPIRDTKDFPDIQYIYQTLRGPPSSFTA